MNLERINPAWKKIPLWTAEETAKEALTRGFPMVITDTGEAIYNKDFVLFLMIDNDFEQLKNLVRSSGYEVSNYNASDLVRLIKEIDKKKPGYIIELLLRFFPHPIQEKYSTSFFRSINYWRRQRSFWEETFPKVFEEINSRL